MTKSHSVVFLSNYALYSNLNSIIILRQVFLRSSRHLGNLYEICHIHLNTLWSLKFSAHMNMFQQCHKNKKKKQFLSLVFTNMLLLQFQNLKGYLRCKTITSQNVSFETQITNFSISQKSYVPFSRYSGFCIFNHLIIYQICDVSMSIST